MASSSERNVLRIKISDTENATIEINPVDGGVEILISKAVKPSDPEPEKSCGGNLDILRDFCSEKKVFFKHDKTMKKELLSFWNFYSKKMEDWKGKVDPERLWKKWSETIGK